MGRSRSRSRSRSQGRHSRSGSRGRRSSRRHSRSRSRSRSSSSNPEGYRIHVANLGIDCSRKEVEHAFEKFGPLIEVWLARNPPCFAFVVYRHKEDADEAIRDMDGTVLCAARIRVSYALPRGRGSFGRRARGFDPNLRCYQCGERGHFSRDCVEFNRGRRYNRSSSRSRSRSRDRSRRSRSRSRERRRPRKDSSRSDGGRGDRDRRSDSRGRSRRSRSISH